FLGVSESVGTFSSLFLPVDKKLKIFAKKPGKTHDIPAVQINQTYGRLPKVIQDKYSPTDLPAGLSIEVSAQKEADRVSLARYGPPGVVINSAIEIIQFRGDTNPFLMAPRGRATFNLLKMAREGLMFPLRNAINKAKKENKRVREEDLAV